MVTSCRIEPGRCSTADGERCSCAWMLSAERNVQGQLQLPMLTQQSTMWTCLQGSAQDTAMCVVVTKVGLRAAGDAAQHVVPAAEAAEAVAQKQQRGSPPCSMGQQFLQHYLDSMGTLNTFG